MAIAGLLSASWALIEAFVSIKSFEYQNVMNVRKVTIAMAIGFFTLSVLAFSIKWLFKDIQVRALAMEFLCLIGCILTYITCEAGILKAFQEGALNFTIDPLLASVLGWTIYTTFCFFPFYWYLFTFLVGSISFFWVTGNIYLKDFPENYVLVSITLLIGGFVRYNIGRNYFEVGEENRRFLESDRLTGVYNRRSYEERIAELRKGKDAKATLVLFDVNGLKPANDTHGHLAGDELIIATANCISKVFDAYGKCFRIGGDEFVVVMDDNAEDINKLMKQLDETTAQWKGNYSDTLSVSYGIAQGKTEGDGISELIKTADANMYEAKRRYYVEHGIERRVTG